MKFLSRICFLVFLIMIFSCQDNKLEVDISNENLIIKVARFEKELFETTANSPFQHHQKLHNKYGTFYKRFVESVIKVGLVKDSAIGNKLNLFMKDATMKEVFDRVNKKYSDMVLFENELTDAFKHYHYYFPERLIPQVISYTSGFNYSMLATDSTLGIGLDMYLGNDCKYYELLGFPKYKTQNMRPENLVSDAMKAWISTEFSKDISEKDMLHHIIQEGKIMYLLDAILPDVEDSLKIGFPTEKINWCKKNEKNIWTHFVEKKLIFTTDYKEIITYLNEGPFTPGLPRESPAKTGVWLGWQIVRSYMNRQEKIDLKKLISADAQVILKESKYKPK